MTPAELRSLAQSSTSPLAFADAFKGLTEADRKKLSKTAQEIYREARAKERKNFGIPTEEGAIGKLALLACCGWTDAKRVNNNGRFGMFPRPGNWPDAVRQILIDRRPAWAQDWIAMRLAESPQRLQLMTALSWKDLRELIKAAVIERPADDGYIRIMAAGWRDSFDPVRDADVFDSDVWRLFQVETHAFGGVPEQKKAIRERAKRTEAAPEQGQLEELLHGWPKRLYEAARDGRIDRDRLIDETLAALRNDFESAMRTGLLRFLEFLELTPKETSRRESTFRQLLATNQPTVIGMALDTLSTIQKSEGFDADAFLEAVPAVFTLADKSRPATALSMIDRIVGGDAARIPKAVQAAAAALNHESAEIEEQAVKLLAKWKETGAEIDVAGLLAAAPSVAAHAKRLLEGRLATTEPATAAEQTGAAPRLDDRRRLLRERLAALPAWLRSAACCDGLERTIDAGTLPAPFDPDPAMCPVLSAVEPLEPIQTVDELIDAVSRLFEVVDGSDAIERVVDGLMRLGGETTDDFEAKTVALRQTKFTDHWSDWTVPTLLRSSLPGLLSLLGHWLGGSFMGSRPTRSPLPALATVDQRFAMLATRFRSRRFGPVLATPTHRGGWIDPRIFVGRMQSLDLGLWLVHKFDLIAGLLRLAPDIRAEALEQAADLPNPYGPIVRYALGGPERPGDVEAERADEWLAAGRARQPRGWLEELRNLGLDEEEPDGITRAVFRLEQKIDFAVYSADRGARGDAPPCVRVVPPIESSTGLVSRPTVALAAALRQENKLYLTQSWQVDIVASIWPANPSAVLGIACCKLVGRIDTTALFFDPVAALMAPLQAIDRGWSEMARAALCLGLLSRNDQSRAIAVDALIEGIADGRADAAALGETLVYIASGGWAKLNRLADSCRQATRTSILAEQIVSEMLDRLIASWDELPRDGHYVLALEAKLLNNLDQAPSAAARAVLAKAAGTGKAVKLAKQLCAREARPESPSRYESALEAAEGRLARAERILRFIANG
jgi:hypothetical protein